MANTTIEKQENSSDKVVEIDDYKPHRQGQALCHVCGKICHIVAPVSTDDQWKECGECGEMKVQYFDRQMPIETLYFAKRKTKLLRQKRKVNYADWH